tara:strand:- start:363 stop:557 length:195 start_codon:yes stop_codon:yes gene_type:complete
MNVFAITLTHTAFLLHRPSGGVALRPTLLLLWLGMITVVFIPIVSHEHQPKNPALLPTPGKLEQ